MIFPEFDVETCRDDGTRVILMLYDFPWIFFPIPEMKDEFLKLYLSASKTHFEMIVIANLFVDKDNKFNYLAYFILCLC